MVACGVDRNEYYSNASKTYSVHIIAMLNIIRKLWLASRIMIKKNEGKTFYITSRVLFSLLSDVWDEVMT